MNAIQTLAPAQPTALPAQAETMLALARQGGLDIVTLFNAAQTLESAGQPAAAIALYRTWLAHTSSPLAYAAQFNLAVALSGVGDDAGAEAAYRTALAAKPDFAEAHLNLGTLQERCGQPEAALATWRAALPLIDPLSGRDFYTQALNNLGRLLEILKRYPEAEQHLRRSLELLPQQPNVIAHWVHLRQKQCKWPVYDHIDGLGKQEMIAATSALATLSASGNPATQLAAARRYVGEKVLSGVGPLAAPGGDYGHARLRIGYLSSDFCAHAVSILTAELFELHDRSKVEVYAFCWSREDGSPLRARVTGAMDHLVRIDAMSDEQAARRIRELEIDVLVDLHGLTLGTRPNILSWRPAPMQVTYLGFPGTTALPSIDYVLADRFVLPPEMTRYFTEKPLYLPHTFQINDRQRAIGPRPSRAECGLPEDAFVFCSFNNNHKFTPAMYASWMRILQRVPHSVLWLIADSEEVRENLALAAESHGVPRSRLHFAGRVGPEAYLARFQAADLFLDTLPFNAGTTASDALWAGLPLLTCAGATFAGRMAGSLLHAANLPQLVTHSLPEYEDLAVALAHDPARIAAFKQQLAAERDTCALFDSPRFVRDFEQVLLQAVRKAPQRIADIPIVTVSYNAPDLIAALLGSLRQFYGNRVYVIDGSRPDLSEQIGAIAAGFENVEFIPFGYNIHHGPGLSWAIEHLGLSGQVLFLDSDVEIVRHGFLESLAEQLTPELYGVGGIQQVNEQGYDVADGAVAYLHPACMLTNIDVVRQWPLPIKHGAPLVQTMLALHRAGRADLLKNIDWVKHDFGKNPERIFIKHDWQGTVLRTGGYHYQMPTASANINTDLLAFVPLGAQKLVEVGCGDGAFAKAYKERNPICNYTGIEKDAGAADQARPHCDFVYQLDAEQADTDTAADCARHVANADCWILGDVIEELADPWALLQRIRASMAPHGTLVLAINNFQHWRVQAHLNSGDLRYQAGGVIAKSRLRLFTRGTILDLLQQTGFQVSGGMARVEEEPGRERYLPALRLMAEASGIDPEAAVADALPYQYIITAVPA